MFSILLTALAASAAFVQASSLTPRAQRVRCGTSPSAEKVEQMEAHFNANRVPASSTSASAAKKANGTTIDVYFHVIYKSKTEAGGYVPTEQIEAQIDVMNEAYAIMGITWNLADTEYIKNSNWFNTVGPDETAQTTMKSKYRTGGKADLNVYTVGFVSGSGQGLLGYSTFPSDYDSNPDDDGVVMLFSSTPGGATENYNEGQTLTHEAGHWVGLYHTFQGGCTGSGDQVSDTPAEAVRYSSLTGIERRYIYTYHFLQNPASGCPADSTDTCPKQKGTDPIHNFMDYSYDSCMTEFTAGQASRAADQLATYRGLDI
ncbi:metalloprotease [Flagelloscypha sp. PMI_526]|nr:metalloprotease [Flagelloscypha sp. PMI_526]